MAYRFVCDRWNRLTVYGLLHEDMSYMALGLKFNPTGTTFT